MRRYKEKVQGEGKVQEEGARRRHLEKVEGRGGRGKVEVTKSRDDFVEALSWRPYCRALSWGPFRGALSWRPFHGGPLVEALFVEAFFVEALSWRPNNLVGDPNR